jgi:hypothetical protein
MVDSDGRGWALQLDRACSTRRAGELRLGPVRRSRRLGRFKDGIDDAVRLRLTSATPEVAVDVLRDPFQQLARVQPP